MFVSRGKRMRKEKKSTVYLFIFSTLVRDAHDLFIAAKSSSLPFQSCRT
jgi:hypothetical protein